MRISSVLLENFRAYKGKQLVEWPAPAPSKNVTIIAGNNGYGKTSFLTALLWCLYGPKLADVDTSYAQYLQGGYAAFLKKTKCRNATTPNMRVRVTFSDVAIPGWVGDVVEIERCWNGREEVCEIWVDGQENELIQEVGQNAFIQRFILPVEIARFFLLDAEKIVHFAMDQSAEQEKSLARAYREVLGLQKHIQLREQLHQMRLRFRQGSASEEELTNFTALEQKIATLEQFFEETDIILAEIQTEKEALEKQRAEQWQELARLGHALDPEKRAILETQQQELIARKAHVAQALEQDAHLIPLYFCKKGLQRLQQPLKKWDTQQAAIQNKRLQKQILEDFGALEGVSTTNYATALAAILQKYIPAKSNNTKESLPIWLASIDPSTYLELTTHLRKISNVDIAEYAHKTKEWKRILQTLKQTSRTLNHFERQSEDAVILRLQEDGQAIQKQLDALEEQKAQVNRALGEANKEFEKYHKAYRQLQQKIKLKRKYTEKDALSQRLIQHLDVFIENQTQKGAVLLRNAILENLQKLLHKKEWIHAIDVQMVNDRLSIHLIDRKGTFIARDSLSKGEQQLYAMALLQAFIQVADIDFPVFIDSPLQKIDVVHARQIIEQYYPNLAKQVVLFPLFTKEIQEKEWTLLQQYVEATWLLCNASESTWLEGYAADELWDAFQNWNVKVMG